MIYIHIPFCKQACSYCNFHFSTSRQRQGELVDRLVQEMELRADYLTDKRVETIYFGGGTPSLLSEAQLVQLLEHIQNHFEVDAAAEITLEANPDDLNEGYLRMLQTQGINRLSIGIQSFHAADLQLMNRAHTAQEALQCVDLARQFGFQDLSIDLIYGTPTMDMAAWEANLQQVLALDLPHISCYCLTVEPQTALDHLIQKKGYPAVDEALAAAQFEVLVARLTGAGYDHYEISNFGKPGHHARHNTNYWRGKHYLGIGPGAHSFNGISRQWNIAHNPKYMSAIADGQLPFERELLSLDQQYNEYVMTALRTMWGIDMVHVATFGESYVNHLMQEAAEGIAKGHLRKENNTILLESKAKFLADGLASDLFV